jgi:membrane protein required for colicin V production
MVNLPTLVDFFVVGIMLVSGLLAMVRGFMREILAIAAWGAAALVTLYAYPRLLPAAKSYLNSDIVATIAVVIGVFIGTLIVVSIITVRISDMILDSRVGALDRTLGFLFGLARGLLIVVVSFLFFSKYTVERQWPDSLTNAKSLVVLRGTGDWLMTMLPETLLETVAKKLEKNKKPGDEQTDAEQTAPASDGYSKPARDSLKKLIEKPAGR